MSSRRASKTEPFSRNKKYSAEKQFELNQLEFIKWVKHYTGHFNSDICSSHAALNQINKVIDQYDVEQEILLDEIQKALNGGNR